MKVFKKTKSEQVRAEHDSIASKKDFRIKGGVLRFQLGLLLALAVCYFLIETAFAVPSPQESVASLVLNEDEVFVMPNFEIEKVKTVPKENNTPQKAKITEEISVVEDDAKLKAKDEFLSTTKDVVEVSVDDIVVPEPVEDVGPISVNNVEFVPVFPGCESLETNVERRECMSMEINEIVKRNFEASIASDYGLTGRLRIDVQFKIDKQGQVSDVKVRAPHKSLEKEAARVTRLIPQMKPGIQGNREVEVLFTKPIIFVVE